MVAGDLVLKVQGRSAQLLAFSYANVRGVSPFVDKMIVGNDVQPLRQAALDFKAGGAVTMRCAPLQNDI